MNSPLSFKSLWALCVVVLLFVLSSTVFAQDKGANTSVDYYKTLDVIRAKDATSKKFGQTKRSNNKHTKEMIYQLVIFDVKPDYLKEYIQASKRSLIETMKEEGNLEIKLFQNTTDSCKLYVYTLWKNEAGHAAHLDYQYTKDLQALSRKALQNHPQILLLDDSQLFANHSKATIEEEKKVSLFVIFDIAKSDRERVLTQLKTHAISSRQEAGNLLFNLYSVVDNEKTIVIYENWRNSSALTDVHVKQPYFITTNTLLNKVLEGGLTAYIHMVTEIK